jgi:Subtilase family
MRSGRLRPIAGAILAGAGLLLPGYPANAAAPAAESAAARTGVRFVTLVTGDRVGVGAGVAGREQVAAEPVAGHGSLTMLRAGGDLYVFPAIVVPYLGVSLDRALFDVSALLRDGTAGQVPVRVSLAPGTAPTVPGVTVTGTPTAGALAGYVTTAGAARFGAALAVQSSHDIRAGLPAGRQLFGGVTSIRYAGRGAPPVATPHFPMFTVRLTATGPDGAPVPFALATVLNTDDMRKFTGFPTLAGGEARISLPAGHYAAEVDTFTVDERGSFGSYFVTTEFEVSGPTATAVDLRRASVRAAFRTPRPADTISTGFVWSRGDPAGRTFEFQSINAGDAAPFVAPAPAPAAGTQHFVAEAQLSTSGYGYVLHGPSGAGIPADQQYRVTPARLATVHESFATDQAGTGAVARFPYESWQDVAGAVLQRVPFPGEHTEYVTARPDIAQLTWALAGNSDGAFGSVLGNGTRVYRAGQRVREDWFRGPIAPGFPSDPGGAKSVVCDACRSGDDLLLRVLPETDATPDHAGFLDFPRTGVTSGSRFRLLSGASVLADQDDSVGGAVAVPAADEPYRLVYDQTRIAPWFGTAPVSHTEWTFHSGRPAANAVPARVVCPDALPVPCGALPLVDIDYHLNGTPMNTMRPGPASMDVAVRHAPYAPRLAIGPVRVSVSFDGGRTARPATVLRRAADRFRAVWFNPATPGPVTLRVRAADVAGNSVDQTIQGAYRITAAAAAAACPDATAGHATCLARYRPGRTVHSGQAAVGVPAGYGPADLRSAYALPATSATATVAVVVAFDYPSAAADLAAYRRAYGLPACRSGSGCLRRVNQRGSATPLPEPDPGWALEAALDLQMATAACPTCGLLLVEADDNAIASLAAGVDTAVRLGAAVVSNSYGADESGFDADTQGSYAHPGVPILASSGDAGLETAQYPAVLPGVIAVGGTTLTRDSGPRGWTERVWSGAGSGCSAWHDKPAWQHDPNCQLRTTADISAVADPDTGVAVHDTFGTDPAAPWLVVGGTSVAAPFLAGVIASTGHPERVTASRLYGRPAAAFNDVVGGSNGFCGSDYLCTGLPGYDAPSGLGTPRGLLAFR